jgi:GH25 family lysozyme M1 (1,4-beta-N-acetylmuramidase)
LEVCVEEIGGIVYYIDKYKNVYRTEDILQGKDNPKIIAKYERTGEKYTIPELGLY